MGKAEVKRPLRRPRRRSEDNIEMDLEKFGWGEWNGLMWPGIETGGGHL